MSHTTIVLFGMLHLRQGGIPRLIRGRKNRLLLAYLAVHHDRLLRRDRVAGTLWPETDQLRARESFRHVLSRLRALLDPLSPSALLADDETISLRTDEVGVDLAVVEDLLRSNDPTSISRALDLAAEELLEDFDDPWVVLAREHLSRVLRDAGIHAASDLYASGDPHAALNLCEKLFLRDRADEQAHRLVLEVRAEQGDLSGLIRQFETCGHAMRQELDAEPSTETAGLFHRLRTHLGDRQPED